MARIAVSEVRPRFWRVMRKVRLYQVIAWSAYLFLIMPSLVVVPISFGDTNELTLLPRHLSLRLYAEFFHSGWWVTAVQSLRVASTATGIVLVVAIPAAYALVRFDIRGKEFINLALLSPILMPVMVLGLGSYLFFARIGLVGSTLGLILLHASIIGPFVLIAVMAGLRHIDSNLEIAATMMGAGRLTIFRRIVLPQIIPATTAGALFAFLVSFDEVVIAYYVTNPASETLPVKMYSSIQWEISPVIAAVSVLLTLVSLIVCLSITFLQKSSFEHNR